MGKVPRGIEVLLKKAAIDPEFRELLLNDPEAAAKSIALELAPVEQAMLKTMPAEQLAVIINQTEVPQQQRRVFLSKSGAAMLALLAALAAVVAYQFASRAVGWTKDQMSHLYGNMSDMPDDRRFGNSGDYRHDWVGGAAPDLPEEE